MTCHTHKRYTTPTLIKEYCIVLYNLQIYKIIRRRPLYTYVKTYAKEIDASAVTTLTARKCVYAHCGVSGDVNQSWRSRFSDWLHLLLAEAETAESSPIELCLNRRSLWVFVVLAITIMFSCGVLSVSPPRHLSFLLSSLSALSVNTSLVTSIETESNGWSSILRFLPLRLTLTNSSLQSLAVSPFLSLSLQPKGFFRSQAEMQWRMVRSRWDLNDLHTFTDFGKTSSATLTLHPRGASHMVCRLIGKLQGIVPLTLMKVALSERIEKALSTLPVTGLILETRGETLFQPFYGSRLALQLS